MRLRPAGARWMLPVRRITVRLRLRRARTIHVRLTLLYGAVFLVTGALLLTIGYLLVRHNLGARPDYRKDAAKLGLKPPFPLPHGGSPPFRNGHPLSTADRRLIEAAFRQAEANALHRLLLEYIAALLAMTAISVAAGWLLAGRALAPLRKITTTARRVSAENLGERIALVGPTDELKELADTFDSMLARLDRTFASQRHFVANASHELRTPLAIMRTELDVALGDPYARASELRTMGEAVRETIDRSEGLIAALLTLARSETVTGREEQVWLDTLAADCVTDLYGQAEEAGIEIRTAVEPAAVRGDVALLERMVANLIDNGIRHNEPGGYLDVQTRAGGGDWVQLAVRNGGAPIGSEVASTLTEPFRRLHRGGGGFGLGLSIVRSVAEAHGGSVQVLAPVEGGLEVLIALPVDPSVAAVTARPPRIYRELTPLALEPRRQSSRSV